MGWSLIIIQVNFHIVILLLEGNTFISWVIETLPLICEITVPGLLKGVGIINKKAIIIIAISMIKKIFLFSLIKLLPLDKRKRENIKINETPSAG
jgi:hypothetical protein